MIRLMDHHCGKKEKKTTHDFAERKKEKKYGPEELKKKMPKGDWMGGKEKVVSFSFLSFLGKCDTYGGDNFLLVS